MKQTFNISKQHIAEWESIWEDHDKNDIPWDAEKHCLITKVIREQLDGVRDISIEDGLSRVVEVYIWMKSGKRYYSYSNKDKLYSFLFNGGPPPKSFTLKFIKIG